MTSVAAQKFSGQRRKMVEEQLLNRGIRDYRLLEVMSRTPRHLFVQESFQDRAYGDHPLPIGESQTISQPYVVAKMTEALNLKGGEKVLEIGTGSGYQTAVLSEMAGQVFTIERIKKLGVTAQRLLDELGYMNVVYKLFDGTYGWPDQAPFDAILITAGAPELPDMLVQQLKDGGRLVAPVGEMENQKLTSAVKCGDKLREESLGDCSFVRLVGRYGWPE